MKRFFFFFSAALLLGIAASFAFTTSTIAPHETSAPPAIASLELAQALRAGPPPAPAPEPVRLLAVGDVMLGRNVENLMKKEGADYPFEKIKPFFDTFDFVFANLEGPIPTKHRPTPSGSTQFSFTKDTGETLKRNSVDIVSLANNHTFDYGKENFENTRRVLASVGVLAAGSQRSADPIYAVTTTIKENPFTFIALNDVFGILDVPAAIETVNQLSGSGSFVFATIHWGDEYKLVGNKRQVDIAHKLIDAGADVIVGHHPHVVQHIELYKEKPIFYSLGNFIFDQYFSQNTQEGLAVGMAVHEKHVEYSLYPVEIPRSQPALQPEEKKSRWLAALAERSEEVLREKILAGSLTVPR